MIERETEIVNRLGMHARAAAKLVHTAGAFQSRVTLAKDGEEVDAKSILGLLTLGIEKGQMLLSDKLFEFLYIFINADRQHTHPF